MVRIQVVLLLSVLSLCYAQLLSNPRRVYVNPPGVTIKAISAAMTACSTTIAILDDSSQCLKFANGNGEVYDWQCTPEMNISFGMFVYASAGYLMTSDKRVVIIDMYSGDVLDIADESKIKAKQPVKIGLFTNFAVPTQGHTWVQADGYYNTTFWFPNWNIDGFVANSNIGRGNSYTSNLITQINNDKPILCLFNPTSTTFAVVLEKSNFVDFYSWTVATAVPAQKYIGRASGFGEITACRSDYYSRMYLWDKGCNCLRVTNTNGVILENITLPDVVGTPRDIQATRNRIYILDDVGIVSYDFPGLEATFGGPTNTGPTCATGTDSTATVSAIATKGSPPYRVLTLPDQTVLGTSANNPNFFYSVPAGSITSRTHYNHTYTIYDDSFTPEYEAISSTGASMSTSTTSSTLAPYSGVNSWRMLMARGYTYSIRTSSVNTGRINPSFFQTLEMYIYVSSGVTKFRIDLSFGIFLIGSSTDPSYYYFDYVAGGNIQYNQWNKVSIDLSMGPTNVGYTRITFQDLSLSNSTLSSIYVDKVRLLPYSLPNTKGVYVRDFCDRVVFSPFYPYTRENVLTANVKSNRTTCNAQGRANLLSTQDGSLSASITGGVLPYSYNWSFTTNTTETLYMQKNLFTSIVVYDSDLNSSFVDRSTGSYNLASTQFVLSGPFSSSIGPNAGTLSFIYITGISAVTFKSITFYVNGGIVGGQLISVGVLDVQESVIGSTNVHTALGVPAIPANIWSKVTISVTSLGVTATGLYYGIQFKSAFNQPNVYIEDVRLIANDVSLTVTDAAGCVSSTTDVFVNSPQVVKVTPTIARVKCYNENTGSISLGVTGGNRPYSYSWSTSATTRTLTNLTAGSYNVSVFDVNTCAAVPVLSAYRVIQPPKLRIIPTIKHAMCAGGKGSIHAKVVGGVDLYTFAWARSTGVSISGTPQNIPTSIYTDDSQNSFAISTTNAATMCNGEMDGFYGSRFGYCALLVQPGVNPTLFSTGCPSCIDGSLYSSIKFWIQLQDVRDRNLLRAYFSNNALNFTREIVISNTTEYEEITLELPEGVIVNNFAIVTDDPTALQGAFMLDAIVLISRNSFNPGIGVSAGFSGLVEVETGTYSIRVRDANGCNYVSNLEITQPESLSITFSSVAPNGNNSDGIITAVVSGGMPPYSHNWQYGNQHTEKVSDLPAGRYSVVVTDSNGCTTSAIATLEPCNCFFGAMCAENGTCVCPEGLLCSAAVGGGGSGGLAGGKLVTVLVIPIIGGFIILGALGYFFYSRKRARLVKEMASKQRSEINRHEIHLETRIGRGASGEVFKGTLRGTDVAVKKLINATQNNIQEFMFESAVMCALRHPNIVLFMGSCFDHAAKEMLLVMEFLNRGSLHDILHEPRENVTHHMKLQITYQAAVGMNFLHQSDPPIIHRDLKSHNILLDDKYNAKISDFGITRFKEISKGPKKQTINEKSSSLGTIYWTAPEVLDGYEANERSDVYSFGVVLWEVFHRKDPYVGKDPLAVADQVLHKNLRPEMDPRLPEEITTLIRSCWDQDPKRRPTFQDIMVQLKALAAGSGAAFSSAMSSPAAIEPPTGHMYIVCMDIDNIMELWDNNTRDTLNDIEMLQEMYRIQLEVYMGYEFHTHMGTAHIAFSKVGHAINWCTTTMTKAMQLGFSPSLLADPNGREVRALTGEVLQRGFRLNFGIFSGAPNCSLDPINNSTKYFGSVIDTAKRIARIAANGSIACSFAVIEDYEKSKPNLTHNIVTRKYNETLSARSKSLEVYKISIAALDLKDMSRTDSGSHPGTPSMPHMVLNMGDDDDHHPLMDHDGLETISITNKTKSKPVKSSWMIELSDIELGESVGRGNLGSYYKAKVRSKDAAVNVLINQKLSNTEVLRLMADITIMSKMNHPNVLQYHGICIEANHLSLAMDYQAKNLNQISSNPAIVLTNQIRTKIALGIAQGMQYISTHPDANVRRNDNLKSNNIMVGKDYDVKITDYGQQNIKDFARTMTTVTSVAWTAPELLNGEPFNDKVPQYSYGVILWELFARKLPYADEHPIKVVSKICSGLRPPIPADVPPHFRKVIEGCWDATPDMRPSWQDIITFLGQE